ncbi:acyl-CoA thioesterase [Mesorhizobium sp. YR577]|jgi:4-hydroxybenzoyl-CoA thioesterase|uniref:acyl-CoA thioesterase n=1 Tax=Mesorhizobium sp. YR577 TaxID=1884373 RepID=UPI0008E20BD9|nr:acyl-CoA thioesterase [Mesorhizobium sp. YR577]SFU21929.1 4-hydroxybenzoyl-CoA thioesterase [Mesorhizobium sp. YR577]
MTHIEVSFGDCDPAGIAFYPNIFRWLDKAFHDWLRPRGGHAHLCVELDALGIGLIDAKAQFRRPIVDGDALVIGLTIKEWSRKTVTIEYEGRIGNALAFQAQEVRGLFKRENGDTFAAEITALKELVETIGEK